MTGHSCMQARTSQAYTPSQTATGYQQQQQQPTAAQQPAAAAAYGSQAASGYGSQTASAYQQPTQQTGAQSTGYGQTAQQARTVYLLLVAFESSGCGCWT